MDRGKPDRAARTALRIAGIALVVGAVFWIRSLTQSTILPYPPPGLETSVEKSGIRNTFELLNTSNKSSPTGDLALDEISFFNRPAEFGTIIETGFSPLHSTYKIVNQWFAQFDDKTIIAYAGAQVNDPENGGQALPEPWPGILLIEQVAADGKHLVGEAGKYRVEEDSGPLRIVDANRDEISLASRDGTIYAFDLRLKTFRVPASDSPFIRQLSKGAIWETGNAPAASEYTFENYWYVEEDGEQIYVFAGAVNADPEQGVIVKYSIRSDNPRSSGSVYFTPVKDGSNRIVDIVDGKLIVISSSGLEYGFDFITEQVFTFDHSTEEFTPLN